MFKINLIKDIIMNNIIELNKLIKEKSCLV